MCQQQPVQDPKRVVGKSQPNLKGAALRFLSHHDDEFKWSNACTWEEPDPDAVTSEDTVPTCSSEPHWFSALFTVSICAALLWVLCKDIQHNGLLGCSNGRYVSFMSSVHSIDRYWWRSRYLSRSILGTTFLKFAGSTLISLFIGAEPIWWTSKRHTVSFLLAYVMVRSDSKEAQWLSDRMRAHAGAQLLLGLMSALYKLRKMAFVADCHVYVGHMGALALGCIAFSDADLLMILENEIVKVTPSLHSSLKVKIPNLKDTLLRNFVLMLLLIISAPSVLAHDLSKFVVLVYLSYYYNKELLRKTIQPWFGRHGETIEEKSTDKEKVN